MKREEFIELIRERVVETCVGPSAMRGQGKGAVEAVRRRLKKVQLSRFVTRSRRLFEAALDEETEQLRRRLPSGAKNWGTARKALNLFLRDCLYNQYLAAEYRLDRVEEWLELPLDSYTGKGLKNAALGHELPRWPGVKHLTPEDSAKYQSAAEGVGLSAGIARVHLDLLLWRK